MAFAAALALLIATPRGARAEPGDDVVPYDGGVVLSDTTPASDAPHAQTIEYFAPGSPPVEWAASVIPVTLCTQQANRPASISAERFRAVAAAGAEMWNNTEAAVGINYTGDCPVQGVWQASNRVNEIAWDDARNIVRPPAAALTQGRWSPLFGRREFIEADIIIDDHLNVPDACFQSIVAHEMGHVIGFGHSDRRGDLMYPSFTSSDASTCPGQASPAEVAWLQSLYGVNRRPVIAPAVTQAVTAGALSQLSVMATDPEGDPLTYQWTQTGGPPVTISTSDASASFIAPASPGATLTFRADVLDRYLHRTSATMSVAVTSVSGRPTAVPELESVRPIDTGARTLLRWTPVSEATFYRMCATADDTGVRTCTDQPGSRVNMAWDAVVDMAGADPLILGGTTREVTVAACNTLGCADFARPIHVGGVTWQAWNADFDVLGMAIDIPAADIRYTVGGVQNVSGAARRFTIYAGTMGAPHSVLIQNCGSVDAGASCLAVLTPTQTGHLPYVVVSAESDGAPTIEYRVPIR